ncbi:MAG: hypothetical protein RLZZ210_1334 [Pseudomonadota bacterium]
MINLRKVFTSRQLTVSHSKELDKQESSVLGNFVPVQSSKSASDTNMQPYMVSGEIYLNSGFTSHTKESGAFSPTASAL